MNLQEKYIKETGNKLVPLSEHNMMSKYIKWLEQKISEPQILTWIKTMFEHAEKNSGSKRTLFLIYTEQFRNQIIENQPKKFYIILLQKKHCNYYQKEKIQL